MTSDEFDRILTALRHANTITVNGFGSMVQLRAVIEILHSNLHHEDKALYDFDWKTMSFRKKST
jgi:hypothetical protein